MLVSFFSLSLLKYDILLSENSKGAHAMTKRRMQGIKGLSEVKVEKIKSAVEKMIVRENILSNVDVANSKNGSLSYSRPDFRFEMIAPDVSESQLEASNSTAYYLGMTIFLDSIMAANQRKRV